MIPIPSSIKHKEQDYAQMKNELERLQFSLGGNWNYAGGSFDKYLDESRTVWLRIPFEMTGGEFDGEVSQIREPVKIGEPFVLKHLYQDGLDNNAEVRTYTGLIDQFQKPVDVDAEVEPEWIEKSKIIMKQVEQVLQ